MLEDLKGDGPWLFDLLKDKLGPEGPERLIEPTAIDDWSIRVGKSIIEVVEFGPGECKHHACFHLADSRSFIAADLIYNGAHLYLQEHNLEGWTARLDEFETLLAENGVQTIYPGHGPAGGLSLIEGTREYLEAFAAAVQTGSAETARATMMARFPDHRVTQFLTVFSLPAYFATAADE